jgi:hypothetical protein
MRSKIVGILLSFSCCLFVSCVPETKLKPRHKDRAASAVEATSNHALLVEVNAAGHWFHAKKTRPIWAQEIKEAKKVKTLEGEETVEPGHFLCRGEAGDIWPQKKADLEKKYVATEEDSPDGWRKYLPRQDAEGVMAAEVGHPFVVHAKWGELKGKAGDFLIKNYADQKADYPADVWLVDQNLFGQTYERVPQD